MTEPNSELDLLERRIRAELPTKLSETGEAALTSFLSLPGVANWRPKKLLFGEVSHVFNVELPFALLGDNQSAQSHKKNLGDAIRREQVLPASDWSEVQAAAILSSWGANVSFVKRRIIKSSGRRGFPTTPDIEVRSGDGVIVDVEVTRGEVRKLHATTQDALESLSGAMRAGDVDWNIVCFFADASNSHDVNAAFEAAVSLQPGEFKQESKRWAVRAVALEQRDDLVGAKAKELFGPAWWPLGEPCYHVNSVLLGRSIPPVVVLYTLIPETSYIDPIRKKADHSQRRLGHPYLIALDTSQMMGAHERVPRQLNGYFPIWDHVSGVMLFDSRFWVGVDRKEWAVSMHQNQHASLPLPKELTGIADGKRHAVQFALAN